MRSGEIVSCYVGMLVQLECFVNEGRKIIKRDWVGSSLGEKDCGREQWRNLGRLDAVRQTEPISTGQTRSVTSI
jgi:hypothetical protein